MAQKLPVYVTAKGEGASGSAVFNVDQRELVFVRVKGQGVINAEGGRVAINLAADGHDIPGGKRSDSPYHGGAGCSVGCIFIAETGVDHAISATGRVEADNDHPLDPTFFEQLTLTADLLDNYSTIRLEGNPNTTLILELPSDTIIDFSCEFRAFGFSHGVTVGQLLVDGDVKAFSQTDETGAQFATRLSLGAGKHVVEAKVHTTQGKVSRWISLAVDHAATGRLLKRAATD